MTIMTTQQAENFLARHDADARIFTRMTKTALSDLLAARYRAEGTILVTGGPVSKDELINALLGRDYPVDKLNEAIHASYHLTGRGGSSACEYCHPHDGGRCDCSPKALEALTARMAAEAAEAAEAAPQGFKVSYVHMRGYRVSRTFPDRGAAQAFIDANAMVCSLPGVKLEPIAEAPPAGSDSDRPYSNQAR